MKVRALKFVLDGCPPDFDVETVDSVDGYDVGSIELDVVNQTVLLLPPPPPEQEQRVDG